MNLFTLGIALGILTYLLIVVSQCSFRVQEGHLAVLSSFGKAEMLRGKPHELRVFGPGLHFKKPWQHVRKVSMMEQNLDLSGVEGGRTAMADDGTILRFDSILRYVPVEKELYQLLFGLRAPIEHITGLFTCLLRNEIANFRSSPDERRDSLRDSLSPITSASRTHEDFLTHGGSFALIRRERKRLNAHLESFTQSQIGNRYGIQFNAVDLIDILPPDELAIALNAVIQAQTEADAAFFRAEGECQQRILASERGVAIARDRASAVEIEILQLAKHLDTLRKQNTLGAYIARRRAEVFSEARTVIVKEPS